MISIKDLLDAVDTLEHAHRVAKEELERELPDIDPYRVKSVDGRFVLLDSLTQIVNARTAITFAVAVKG